MRFQVDSMKTASFARGRKEGKVTWLRKKRKGEGYPGKNFQSERTAVDFRGQGKGGDVKQLGGGGFFCSYNCYKERKFVRESKSEG